MHIFLKRLSKELGGQLSTRKYDAYKSASGNQKYNGKSANKEG